MSFAEVRDADLVHELLAIFSVVRQQVFGEDFDRFTELRDQFCAFAAEACDAAVLHGEIEFAVRTGETVEDWQCVDLITSEQFAFRGRGGGKTNTAFAIEGIVGAHGIAIRPGHENRVTGENHGTHVEGQFVGPFHRCGADLCPVGLQIVAFFVFLRHDAVVRLLAFALFIRGEDILLTTTELGGVLTGVEVVAEGVNRVVVEDENAACRQFIAALPPAAVTALRIVAIDPVGAVPPVVVEVSSGREDVRSGLAAGE